MNVYQQVLANAERAKRAKRDRLAKREKWWLNPLRFLDVEDVFRDDGIVKSTGKLMAIARDVFAENQGTGTLYDENSISGYLPGSVDVQRTVLMDMFRASLRAYAQRGTLAQLEALLLAREAKQLGITPSMHIADRRHQTPQSALRLLKRAEKSIMVQNGMDNDILKVEKKVKIHARMIERQCAVCGKRCEDNLNAMCKSCHYRYVYRDDYLNDAHRREIEDDVRLNVINHWHKAREALKMQGDLLTT